jgi:UDP-glucuronate decarboxylase
MMRILVTGGAGFLGSHLCERLLADGDMVVCLDNFSTGKRENINHLEGANFDVWDKDVLNLYGCGRHIDQIYNLACPASPKAYQADPVKTMKTSVLGAIDVLELAKRSNARVLQASTSEVYGDPEEHPQSENYNGSVNPIGIRACYDEGKRAAETLFMDYRRQYKVDTCIARIFNTYGPRMQPDDGRIVSTFIRQALSGEALTVFGDGSQTRSFCYVSDLVDGLILLMNSTMYHRKPFNLGSDFEYSVMELAHIIRRMANSKSKIITCPLPLDDPKLRRPNLERAWERLGYAPKVPLGVGLMKTIEWFQGREPRRSVIPKRFPVIQGL